MPRRARDEADPAPVLPNRAGNGRERRARCWVATVWDTARNRPPHPPLPAGLDYVVYQREYGHLDEEDQRPREHLQMYLEFSEPVTEAQARRILDWAQIAVGPNGIVNHHGVWMAPRSKNSTQKQAIDYCKKVETRVPGEVPHEYGQKHPDDAPANFAAAVRIIAEGGNALQVAQQNPQAYVRFGNGLERLQSKLASANIPDYRPVVVFVHWGPTGTGKTREVYQLEGYKNVHKVMCSGGGSQTWFDGYEGQPVLLLDEFTGRFPIEDVLQYLDVHPLVVNIKHSSRVALWTKVYITSNKSWDKWYPLAAQEHKDALYRRICTGGIKKFEGPGPAAPKGPPMKFDEFLLTLRNVLQPLPDRIGGLGLDAIYDAPRRDEM